MVNDKALIKNEHWVDMCRDGLGCMHKIKTPFRARVLTRLGGLCGRLMRKRFFTLTSYDLHLSSDSECWNDNLSVFCNCWREKKIPGSMRRSKLHVEYELPTIRPHALLAASMHNHTSMASSLESECFATLCKSFGQVQSRPSKPCGIHGLQFSINTKELPIYH